MARKNLWVDDLTGEPADETVEFGLDGREYHVDLTEANAKRLRGCLHEFIEAIGQNSTEVDSAVVNRTALIRDWARRHGYKVNDRGRIPATIQEAYEKSH